MFLPEGCSNTGAGFLFSKALAILSSETLKWNWTKPWAAEAEFRVHFEQINENLSKRPSGFCGLKIKVLCLLDCTKDFNIETSNVSRWEVEICFSSKLIFSSLIALEYYLFNRVFSMPLYQSLYQPSQCLSSTIPSPASLIVNTESSMMFPLLHSTQKSG